MAESPTTDKIDTGSLRYRPDAALVGVAMIWGLNIPIMKIGLDRIDPYVFNAIRLTLSTVVLAVCAQAERRYTVQLKPSVSGIHLLIYGILASGLYQLLFLLGIDRTTSGNTAMIMATVPMWTALLARVLIGERLIPLAWCGLIVALIGTATVALQNADVTAGSAYLQGNLCVLGAALVWSAATVFSRPMLTLISPLQLAASAAVITWPLHLLFAVGRYENSLSSLQSTDIWLIIAYAGILSSGLALPMWNLGVRHAGAAHAAIIQNLIPIVAILAAWVWRNETASPTQIFGGGLILTGLVIMRSGRQIRHTKDASAAETVGSTVPRREQPPE